MKLLFVFDMRVYENRGNYYTTSITQEVIDRYRQLCGSLSWCACVIPHDDEKFCRRFNRVRKDSVAMISLHKINTAAGFWQQQKENDRILEQAVRAHDMLIIRLPSMTGIQAIRLAEHHHKPYMVELVSCTWDALWNHSFRGRLLAPFSWQLMRRTMKRIPMAMYVTRRFLQRRYPCGGESIGCSDVSLPARDPEVLVRRLERIEQTGRRTEPLRVGTLAAVNVRYKGQQDVIAAMGRLKRQGIRVEYELAGSGDPEFLLNIARKWGVEEQVHILGSIPHEQIFLWFENLDVYIQPSKQEGLPRAVVEAMSQACPVIGARTGGIPELIAPQMVFAAGRVRQICRIVKKLDCRMLRKHAVRNYNKAGEYEWEVLEQKRQAFYLRFLERVAETNGKSAAPAPVISDGRMKAGGEPA